MFRELKNKTFYLAAAVFLLAIFVRGLYLYQSSGNPTFFTPIVDSLTYDQMAREVVEGKGLTYRFFWQPLFYPLFLSMVYWFSNSSILAAKIIQMILGAFTCVLVYRLGTKFFGAGLGTLAGIIPAVYMPLVFFEGELLAAGWAAFFSVVTVIVLLKAKDSMSGPVCFTLGLCLILSIVVRPVFLPFAAVGLVWLVFEWMRKRLEAKKIAYGLISIIAGIGVIAVPAGIAGFKVTGHVRFLPFSGGINFYVGNNINYRQTINIRPGSQWDELTEMPLEYNIVDEQARERFFLEKSKDYIFNEPLSFLKGLCYKTAQFINSREMPRNVDIYLFRKWSGLLRAGVWKNVGFGFPFGVLLPLAVLGAVYQHRKIAMPVWLFMIFYSAAVIIVFVTARYRVPVIPLMSVAAAGGFGALLQMLREQKWKKLATAIAIFLGVAFCSSTPNSFYAEQIDYKSELYYVLGGSLKKQGKTEHAMRAYSKAIGLRADYSEAYYNLAALLAEQDRTEEAIEHYSKAIEIRPDDAKAHNNLGLVLQSQGRVKEAISHYRLALQLKPNHAKAHNNLGLALVSQDNYEAAIDCFHQALEIRPDYLNARINLSMALYYQGKFNEALSHYRQVLQIRPEYTAALNGIARILATHPQPQKRDVVRAIALAERAAELTQYQDAFVLNTLAIAYASAGRFDRALETAQLALELALAEQNNELASHIRQRLESMGKQVNP